MDIQPGQLLAQLAAVSALALTFTFFKSLPRSRTSKFWESQPFVGTKKQSFSWMRATLRSIRGSQAMVDEGYDRVSLQLPDFSRKVDSEIDGKFSKFNLPFVLPSMASGPIVVIPPSQLKSILSRPESELEAWRSQNETIQASYTIRDEDIYVNNFHVNVIRKQLTRNLESLTQDIVEELALGFQHYWGTSTEWTTVKAWESCLKIVARAANRVFVGIPLCRNERFLEHSRKYSMSVFAGATVINMFPSFLRPVIGPLVTFSGKKHFAICLEICLPIVEERLRNTERKRSEPDFQWDTPEDCLQWVIEECYKTEDLKQLRPAHVAHRLLMLNLVSIHSTSFTTTNTILDLYSSHLSEGFVDGLREECDRVLAEFGGAWTKDAVSKLFRVDSTIRESMRFSDFGVVALPRRVSASHGIELDGDICIPKGIRIGVPMHAIHHDETFYPTPSHFDAFRFSRPREAYEAKLETAKTREDIGSARIGGEKEADRDTDQVSREAKEGHGLPRVPRPDQASSVTVGDTFLSFGHGKHACPGRFFASYEMKLMLAHLIQHYDVDLMAERPANQVIMEVMLPSESTQIRVRRKIRV